MPKATPNEPQLQQTLHKVHPQSPPIKEAMTFGLEIIQNQITCRFLQFGTNFRMESSNSTEQKMGLHFFPQMVIWGRCPINGTFGEGYNIKKVHFIQILWDAFETVSMKMPLTSHEMIGIGSGANPKEAITKDWVGYLWQILLFPQATVCLPAEAFHLD